MLKFVLVQSWLNGSMCAVGIQVSSELCCKARELRSELNSLTKVHKIIFKSYESHSQFMEKSPFQGISSEEIRHPTTSQTTDKFRIKSLVTRYIYCVCIGDVNSTLCSY